jgi:uncharacterized protein YidB (DUF937 family)
MSKRLPSLAALLGLVAVAGYQNREKIGEFVKGLTGTDPATAATGAIESVKKTLGDGPIATKITGGLGELVDQFKNSGQGDKAESWVATGPNAPITESQMETALGPDLIDGLIRQTGLTREDLLARLSKLLPEAVDKLTPDGKIPA